MPRKDASWHWPHMDANQALPTVTSTQQPQQRDDDDEWEIVEEDDVGSDAEDDGASSSRVKKPLASSKPDLSLPPSLRASYSSSIVLYVNGVRHTLDNPSPHMSTATYLRTVLRLTGMLDNDTSTYRRSHMYTDMRLTYMHT